MESEIQPEIQMPLSARRSDITLPVEAKADNVELGNYQAEAKEFASAASNDSHSYPRSSEPACNPTESKSADTKETSLNEETNHEGRVVDTVQGYNQATEDVTDSKISTEDDTMAKKDRDTPEANGELCTDEIAHEQTQRKATIGWEAGDTMSEGSQSSDEFSYRHLYMRQLEEKKKAPMMVREFMDGIKLMEDRMAAMAEQIQKLRHKPAEPEPVFTQDLHAGPIVEMAPPPPPPKQQLILGISRLKWDKFVDRDSAQTHVITVLLGDPDHFNYPPLKKQSRAQEDRKEKPDEKKGKTDEKENIIERGSKAQGAGIQSRLNAVQERRSIMPERISINSDLLIKILNEITDQDLQGPLVILRPYKLLLHCAPQIRQRLRTLEQRWEEIDSVAAKELEQRVAEDKETELAVENNQTNKKTQSADDSPLEQSSTELLEAAEAQGNKFAHDSELSGTDGKDSRKAPNQDTTEGTKDQKDDLDDDLSSTEGKPALKRLRLLVEFMDKEISAPLAELKKVQGPKQVYFADLYHFFPPGEEVLQGTRTSSDHDLQVYRILQCTGGRRYNDAEALKKEDQSLDFKPRKRCSPFVISCLHIDFDGKELGPVTTTFTITEYVGQRSTITLPVIPWPFLQSDVAPSLRGKLQDRALRFLDLAQVAHKDYTGLTIEPRGYIDSQVIIDFSSSFQYNPEWTPDLDIQYPSASDSRETAPDNPTDTQSAMAQGTVLDCWDYSTYWIHDDATIDQTRMKDFIDDQAHFLRDRSTILLQATDDAVELDPDFRILLPGRVFGFVLRSRTWAALSINLVKDRNVSSDGFKNLVLPMGHKELVKAIVKPHSRDSRSIGRPIDIGPNFDLVEAKGKGLIILCHGVPGVGKTSTAECIADYTQRPLFPITCGDIGETASSVETNLAKHFQLAHRWGCVLLLDEADVFMAKRVLGSANDIQRNSLVSVFLRVLEYYSGILFLTTNRVGTFDPAFKSRIHIHLYYPPLDRKATISIWKVNLARLRESNKDYDIVEEDIIQYAEELFDRSSGDSRLNGRQIKNAFQTAVALAEFEANILISRSNLTHARESPIFLKPQVAVRHFESVSRAATMFDRYLNDVHGGQTESDLARKKAERKDDFDQQSHAKMAPPPSRRAAQWQQQTPRQSQSQPYPMSNIYSRAPSASGFEIPPDNAYSSFATDPYESARGQAVSRRQGPRSRALGEGGGEDSFDDTAASFASRPSITRQPTGPRERVQHPVGDRQSIFSQQHEDYASPTEGSYHQLMPDSRLGDENVANLGHHQVDRYQVDTPFTLGRPGPAY